MIKDRAIVRPRKIAEAIGMLDPFEAIHSLDDQFTYGLCSRARPNFDWYSALAESSAGALVHVCGDHVSTLPTLRVAVAHALCPNALVGTEGHAVWLNKILVLHGIITLRGENVFRH